jgi:hypothetical protein
VNVKPPAGLGTRGRRLFRALSAAFDFDAGESVILAEACRTADLVDRLAGELTAAPLVVEGSRGQQIVNPVAAELRQQRDLLSRLLGRRGNDARWHRPKGA